LRIKSVQDILKGSFASCTELGEGINGNHSNPYLNFRIEQSYIVVSQAIIVSVCIPNAVNSKICL